MASTKRLQIREGLAELEHEQWVKWSKSIADVELLSPDRLGRWEKLWVPYFDLTEEQKNQDREWADKSLTNLHSQDVVIKTDEGLPSVFDSNDEVISALDYVKKLEGWVKVEPLLAKEQSHG